MASSALELLTSALEERGLRTSFDEIAWSAMSSKHRADIGVWAERTLDQSVLLTKEERVFTDAVTMQQQSTGLVIPDEMFECAITSLEMGTAAMQRQCRLLSAQKAALIELKDGLKAEDAHETLKSRQQIVTKETAQLDIQLDQLVNDLRTRLQRFTRKAEDAAAALPASIERALEKDDRILDGLQRIMPRMTNTSSSQMSSDEVDRLCHAFVTLEGNAIRTSIDRIYGSSLRSQASRSSTVIKPNQEQEAVRSELVELSGEVDGLLSLLAENHFRVPFMKASQRADDQMESESATWSEYTASVLLYLTARLESLNEHFNQSCAHQAALSALQSTLDMLLNVPKPKTDVHNGQSAAVGPPHRGLRPLRLVQANLSEPLDPTAQLLRQFDIKDSGGEIAEDMRAKMFDIIHDRRSRLFASHISTEEIMARQAAASGQKAETDASTLTRAILKHSNLNDVRLLDESLQSSSERLEEKTKALSEAMRTLDLENLTRHVKMKHSRLTVAS